MAADSIAKLAVLILGDANPLGQALRSGAQMVDRFVSNTNASFAKMAFKKGFQAVAGAVADEVRRGAESLMQYEDRMMAVGKQYDELLMQQGRFTKASVDGTNTLSTQWTNFKQNLADSGAGLASLLIGPLKQLNDLLANTNSARDMQTLRAQADAAEKSVARQVENQKKKNALIEEERRLQAKLIEEAQRKMESDMEALRNRAEAIRESLRTPDEVFRDTISELKVLQSQGLLSLETFSRGIAKAREELTGAAKARRDLFSSTQSVAAVERHTAAGFSAVQSGKAELARIEALEKQQLAEAKNAAKQRDNLIGAVRNIRSVELTPSNL